MKLNNKPTTDINQSKKLLDLGIKKETADFGHLCYERDECGNQCGWEVEYLDNDWQSYWDVDDNSVPAWSLYRLIEMMPFYCIKGPSYINDNLFDDIIAHIEWLISEGLFNEEYLNKK